MAQKVSRRVAQPETQNITLSSKGKQSTESIKYSAMLAVSTQFGLDRVEIKNLFGISERSQHRYKEDSVLRPEVADRLERFKRIFNQAVELFEDETEAQGWLTTPKVALDNQTPLSILGTDAGAKKVEQILYRAEYGMYG